MRKLLKSLRLLVIVAVVLIVIVAVAVSLFASSAVRVAVETAGTKALSVGVELDAARLSILRGSLTLRDLTVANPPGYQHDTLLKLDNGDVAVRTQSLLTDEVLIRDIQLDGMDLVVEQKGLSNNLQDIIKAAKRGGDEPSGKKLYVNNLELTNVTVNVKLLPVPGKADTATLKLAPIKMTDLGRNGTLDIATLTSKIILAVAAGIADQGTDVLPKEMIDGLTTVVDTALDLGKVIL
ncbi:MAG: AsmA family protein, partial [Planctomycetota bacterium]